MKKEKSKRIFQALLIVMLTIAAIIIPFTKVVKAENAYEQLSSGKLADEFSVQITEGITLKNLKPKYENNELYFLGNLENKTNNVAYVKLSGKITLSETKEEIEIAFENEIGANSTIENVKVKTIGNVSNINLDQEVNKSIKIDYKLTEGKNEKSKSKEKYYYEKEKGNVIKDIFLIVIPMLCLCVSYAIWNAFGRDTKIKVKETHHPIKNTNSMEMAYLFQDKCDNNDIASLIIYLANAGFISIEETELKDGHKNKVYKLKKVKEYDLKDNNEKLLMDTIFKDKKEITTDALGNSLNDIKKEIKANMKVKYSDEKMYTKGEIIRKVFVSILVIISVLVLMIVPKIGIANKIFGLKEIIMTLVLLLLGIMPAFLDLQSKRAEKLELYVYMLIDVVLTVAFMYFIRNSYVVNRHFYEAIISGAFIVVMLLLLYLMPKKKENYAEKYQRIVELKAFIKSGDERSLEKLVKEDSAYFYSILPFATSLEVDEEWIMKSNGIVKAWPKWYKKQSDKYETEKFLRKYKKLIQTLEYYAGNIL